VGAAALHPGTAALVVDFGTAITIDLVSADGEFLGGNISPGAAMRFSALHEYTGKLPLLALTDTVEPLGRSTTEAIEAGVINGILYEIEGYIARISKKIANLHIIFTGGDGIFFAKRVNYPIFASADLVLYGLNRVLEHNTNQNEGVGYTRESERGGGA
jgi:type III pantothenate kinase